MRKQRKHYTAEEKVAVLRWHLVDKVPLSKLCDELASAPENRPLDSSLGPNCGSDALCYHKGQLGESLSCLAKLLSKARYEGTAFV